MTMRQLRQRIARDLKDAQKGSPKIPRSPDGAGRALAGNLLACRYCGGPLLADGEGGWTCPKRDTHKVTDA